MSRNGRHRPWNPGPPYPVEARGCLYGLLGSLLLAGAVAVVIWWLG